MGKDCGPFTYVVPAAVVARALGECHQAWLQQPGKMGQQRKDGDMRRMLPDYSHLDMGNYGVGWMDTYKEGWHLLEQTTSTSG